MGVYVAWGYVDDPGGSGLEHTWTIYTAEPAFAAQAHLSGYASWQQPYHLAEAVIAHYTGPSGQSGFIGAPVAAVPNATSVTFEISAVGCYAAGAFTIFT